MSRFILTVVVFAILGPLAGALGVVLGLAVAFGAKDPSSALNMLLLSPFALIVGGVVGFIPAAACGLVAAAVSPKLPTLASWTGVCVLAGAVLGAALGSLAAPNYEWWILASAGGFAALVCALATARVRPQPR